MPRNADRTAPEANCAPMTNSPLDGVEMITALQVGAILYPSADNSTFSVKCNRENGYILGFPVSVSEYLYPLFQFDMPEHRVRPEVKRANGSMMAHQNPWAVMAWWMEPNEYIEGELSPMEMIDSSDGLSEDEIEQLITVQFDGH